MIIDASWFFSCFLARAKIANETPGDFVVVPDLIEHIVGLQPATAPATWPTTLYFGRSVVDHTRCGLAIIHPMTNLNHSLLSLFYNKSYYYVELISIFYLLSSRWMTEDKNTTTCTTTVCYYTQFTSSYLQYCKISSVGCLWILAWRNKRSLPLHSFTKNT